MAKKVLAEHYDVTIKLTFSPFKYKMVFFSSFNSITQFHEISSELEYEFLWPEVHPVTFDLRVLGRLSFIHSGSLFQIKFPPEVSQI